MAALASTTLAAAVATSAQSIRLASATDVTTIGQWLFTDGEAMVVLALPDNFGDVQVQRGVGGTRVSPHASGAVVYIGTSSQFQTQDPIGVPPTWPAVTPWINLINGTVWASSGGAWVLQGGSGAGTGTGAPVFQTAPALTSPTITGATITTSTFRGTYKSSDGTSGVSAGPFTTITAITVKDGLITAITGS